MNALEIRNLTKSYPGFKLDNLTLTLPKGCIMGLIGENGAGKSTTIKLILNMIHKDSGSITILGNDNSTNLELTKEDIGVVMDEVGIPECLTPKQVGNVMKHTFRNWDTAEYSDLLDRFSLPKNKQFKEFFAAYYLVKKYNVRQNREVYLEFMKSYIYNQFLYSLLYLI